MRLIDDIRRKRRTQLSGQAISSGAVVRGDRCGVAVIVLAASCPGPDIRDSRIPPGISNFIFSHLYYTDDEDFCVAANCWIKA